MVTKKKSKMDENHGKMQTQTIIDDYCSSLKFYSFELIAMIFKVLFHNYVFETFCGFL